MENKLVADDLSSSLRERVFFAARDGMALTLYALIYEKSTEEIDTLLNRDVCCDGVKCTPLIAAARHGRDAAVRILLEKFSPPVTLEREGTVKFDEYVIVGATALWCAAGAGHLGIVKRLVRAGADVNHATETLSTPLRAACFDGRLDIVKYLVRHGADIHIANKYNNTCLMIAAYKGHLEVVQFLLDSGARVDERALCGATALHFAAECGHASTVSALIDHNAKILTNQNGMTPLQCAAERARASVVELLASRGDVTRAQAIEAYELLGASFANDKEYYCLRLAYQYLHRAMAMRYDSRYDVMLKEPADPIPAYDNWRESTTLEEVERLHGNPHALHMEGLTVRERVLGRSCPDLPHPVVFRGAVFADEARFDRCLALWRHALELRHLNSVSVVKDLLRFAQVFSQMIHIGIELPLSQVCFVLEACAEEIRRGHKRLEKPQANQDLEALLDEYESNVRTALYLVAVAARLLENNNNSEVISLDIRRAVFSLRKARSRSGGTLLHLAVDRRTPVDDFHTSSVCQFPCTRTTRLLLDCGADVDTADEAQQTPLHIALLSYQFMAEGVEGEAAGQWSEALCGCVCELLTRGAHVDAVDYGGMTPLLASIGGPAESLVRSALNPRLSCLAATALALHRTKFDPQQVPRSLHDFLVMHGVYPM
ncbi:protein fem-1 homolog B-like isoform X1 [Leptidea sinapis]|uniref:protein fem-1 homolog B-like isoform X1 n=1 Tax=Leptidea sinapis TaxID=189913 RepID=UPI0021275E4F|nr:protein fem-1 homolog B-like isoform X1 [Leptidea sinapis]